METTPPDAPPESPLPPDAAEPGRGSRLPHELYDALERLLALAVTHTEVGPPLAALSYAAGWREFGDRVVRSGVAGGVRGVEYFTIAALSARREGRHAEVLGLVLEALRAYSERTDATENEGARLLQLVRHGFATLLFDLGDPRADLAFVSALAERWGELEDRLTADPLFHVLRAQILWYVDPAASEAAWADAAAKGEAELVWNARGTWAKDAERDLGAAEKAYRTGIDAAPHSALLLHNLAQLLIERATAAASAPRAKASAPRVKARAMAPAPAPVEGLEAHAEDVVEAADASAAEAADASAAEAPDASAAEAPDGVPVETPDVSAADTHAAQAVETPDTQDDAAHETQAAGTPEALAVETPNAPATAAHDGPAPFTRAQTRDLAQAEELLHRALRCDGRGVRRHVHATLDRLMALKQTHLAAKRAQPDGNVRADRPERAERPARVEPPREPREPREPRPPRAPRPPKVEAAPPAPPAPPPNVGEVVSGKVVSLTEFGVFLELPSGHVGLMHRTEISHDRGDSGAPPMAMGELVEVKVLSIAAPDTTGKVRIGLSRRALLPAPERPAGGDRGPRPDRGDRPVGGDRGPRPSGTHGGGDRGPRPSGTHGGGDRGPRPSGTHGGGDRGPRPQNNDRDDRGPRPERNDRSDRGPRPENSSSPSSDRFGSEGKVSMGELLLAQLRKAEEEKKKR